MNEGVNRAFLYGESVFTTGLMLNGIFSDWDQHFDRLKRGVEFVYGPFTDGEDWFYRFRQRLEDRLRVESGDKVIRLTVFREQNRGLGRQGLIDSGDLKINLNASTLEPARAEGKSVRLRSCQALMRPQWWPSYLKAGNYLSTILAQKMFLQPEDDDLLFLSPQDTILESSVANIFTVRHNKLYTPPVGPNVLEGVMRKKVLEAARDLFEEVVETETTLEQALRADGVFGTNSVRGPFPVGQIDDRELTRDEDFLEKLKELRRRVLL